MNKRAALVIAPVLCAVAISAHQTFSLFVNGAKLGSADFVVANGKTYVSTDALAKAGAEVTKGAGQLSVQFVPNVGRMQADGVQGLIGEWVSNETWRIRVSELKEITNPFGRGPGVSLKIEVRNLTPRSLSMHGSGIDQVQLFDSEGNQLAFADSSFSGRYTAIPQAGGFENVMRFGDTSNKLTKLGKPDKLLILFRNAGAGKPLPNFRIMLQTS
ncbi:MAG: hypothetical protein WD716_02840 [Fimbriimonadaceae bacterium]